MKASENKCHVLFSANENVLGCIGTPQTQNSSSEKLLGVKIASKINLKDHLGSICKKNLCQIKLFDQNLRLHES